MRNYKIKNKFKINNEYKLYIIIIYNIFILYIKFKNKIYKPFINIIF